MWNNGHYVLWQHIVQLFYQDVENGLKLMPRLTYDHIKLNSYSTMRVSLAAQVLSSTVAAVWQLCLSPHPSFFIRMMFYFVLICFQVPRLKIGSVPDILDMHFNMYADWPATALYIGHLEEVLLQSSISKQVYMYIV